MPAAAQKIFVQRRRLTLPGVKPLCPFEQSFENFWLCGAIQPNSGENFVLELPATDGDCLQVFLDQFAAAHAQDPNEIHVLLMDNGGARRAKALRWPERVLPVYLPAYCPELNPIERWWQELKDAVSNTLFNSLDALRGRLDAELSAWNQGAERLCSLTSYPYLIDALAMLD
jgi:transposase